MTAEEAIEAKKPFRLCINVKKDKAATYDALQELAKKYDVEFTSLIWHVLESFLQKPSKPENLPSRKEKLQKRVQRSKEAYERDVAKLKNM